MDAAQNALERRLLVLAPTAKDAKLAQSVLGRSGVTCFICSDLNQLCAQIEQGAGAIMLPEEAIVQDQSGHLAKLLRRQAPWSDLPMLVLTRPGADSATLSEAMDLFVNMTVLERPTRVAALVSAVRTALRARQRQYQIRDQLTKLEQSTKVQALLASIVSCSDDAIISKTMDGKILSWNAGAETLFGYSGAEAIGQPITLLIPPERQDEERILLESLHGGERIVHFETMRVAKDGRRIDISLTVSPVRDAQGKIIAASEVARDHTQRKQAEAALRDADRRKDEFLAMLAHELRNPLAPLRNSLHILRLTARDDQAIGWVGEMMERQVDHMVRLVDDLLEVSRITRGKIELRKEVIDVAELVRSALETSQPGIEAAGHQITLSISSEPLTLLGDPVRLVQVITNLLNNATKYTETGGQLWITVARVDQEVTISVRDNGTGIPPEMLPRVFELFTQVDPPSGHVREGLGIGLALVKLLVEMHDGTVVARSQGAGMGSEFVVRLPLMTDSGHVRVPKPTSKAPGLLPMQRVLVVDDNRDAAESLGMLLQMLGADAHVVFNGSDALEAVGTYQPAVVLLDVGMPGMDGHEVARRIRQQPEFREVVLIALTGWGQEDDRRRSQSAGFDYHLIKPVDVSVLEAVLVSIESRLRNGHTKG